MLERWDSEQLAIDFGNRIEYAYSGKMNEPAPGSRELKSIESLNRIGICIFHTALLAGPARGARREKSILGSKIQGNGKILMKMWEVGSLIDLE